MPKFWVNNLLMLAGDNLFLPYESTFELIFRYTILLTVGKFVYRYKATHARTAKIEAALFHSERWKMYYPIYF